MAEIRGTHSCGVEELAEILEDYQIGIDPAVAAREAVLEYGLSKIGEYVLGRWIGCGVVWFVDVKCEYHTIYDGRVGAAMTELILDQGLGKVWSADWYPNPVHPTHLLKQYTWLVDNAAYKRWAEEQPEYQNKLALAQDMASKRRRMW